MIFRLPDLGEGLADAEIREWHVKCGDEVKVDQPLLSVETAKAVVEIPAPQAGKIVRLHGAVGDIVATGAILVEFAGAEAAAKPLEKPANAATVAGKLPSDDRLIEEDWGLTQPAQPAQRVIATPAVRALAKQLGVDLTTVVGTGGQGSITLTDVKTAAANLSSGLDSSCSTELGWEALRGVRRMMAAAMAKSHREVAAVTVFEDADIGDWEEKTDISFRLIRALVQACRIEPALNAWYHGEKNLRKLFSNVDLGLAVDSKEGLFVPVLRGVEHKNAQELRQAIEEIKLAINNRTLAPEELSAPTITLSNFGIFAGKYAEPVVVPPTVAILAAGKIRAEARVKDGQILARKIIPLSLTFDHRAVTGGEATRFLKALLDDLQAKF